MFQSENINELAAALSKAQGEISPAIKDNVNPHFKSKYADLNSVWNACRQPLSKNGLAIIQTMGHDDKGHLQLITTLVHSSGQWIKSHLPIVTQKNDAQGIGSALTYMRRYSLSAIVGIAPDEDDDGESAMNRTVNKKSAPTKVISNEQAEELNIILSECDPDYQASVWKTLNKPPIGIDKLEQLPASLFDRIKSAAIKNRDNYQEYEEIANG
jgi:hypothetical protein